MPNDDSTRDNSSTTTASASATTGLAIMRLGLGAMFLYVFFENLSKGLYGKGGVRRVFTAPAIGTLTINPRAHFGIVSYIR